MLERCDNRLEELEEELLRTPTAATLHGIHSVRRELLTLRRAAWPTRQLRALLQRDMHECLAEATRPYFRDIYDHCVQIIDLIETYREITAALTETYVSIVSSRLKEIMKVLTVIGTVFLPLDVPGGRLRHEHADTRERMEIQLPAVLGIMHPDRGGAAVRVPAPGLGLRAWGRIPAPRRSCPRRAPCRRRVCLALPAASPPG